MTSRRRWATALSGVVLTGMLAWSSGAFGAHRTTAPAPAGPIPVTRTQHGIKIGGFVSKHGNALYPRGALIDFILKNDTKDDVLVRLKLKSKLSFQGANAIATYTVAGKPIRPGKLR